MDTPNNQPNVKHSLYLKARSTGRKAAEQLVKDAMLAKLVNDIPIKVHIVNNVSEEESNRIKQLIYEAKRNQDFYYPRTNNVHLLKHENFGKPHIDDKPIDTLKLIFPDTVRRQEFIDKWDNIAKDLLIKQGHLPQDEPTLQDNDYKELIDKWNKSRQNAEQQGAIYHLGVDALKDSKPIVFVNGITGIEVHNPNYDTPDFKATVEQMREQWDNADRHIKHYYTVDYPVNNTVPHVIKDLIPKDMEVKGDIFGIPQCNTKDDRVTAMNNAIYNYGTTTTHTVTPYIHREVKRRNWFYLLINKLFNIE